MKKTIYSKQGLIIRIILSVIAIVLLTLSFVFQTQIERLIFPNNVSLAGVKFRMDLIDVGHGDSILLRFSDNKTMLIDAGKESQVDKVLNFLDSNNITTIDYFVYSHSDEDHIGGAEAVFEHVDVKVLYRPKELSRTEDQQKLYEDPYGYSVKDTASYDEAILAAYNEEGCDIRWNFVGEKISGQNNDYTVEFLSPSLDTYTEENLYSAVIMVEVENKKVLLMGDAETQNEKDLIKRYSTSLKADILKVGHHGSKTSSSVEFLNLVSPEYALISVGTLYNLPSSDVVDRLKSVSPNVLDTKTYGTISAGIFEGGRIAVNHQRGSRKLDMPLIVSIFVVILLLVWGIRLKKQTKKAKQSSKKQKS